MSKAHPEEWAFPKGNRNLKKTNILLSLCLALTGAAVVGCGDSVPENTRPADGSNPRVGGSAEERIKTIEGNPQLSPEEKARRIQVVKDRNHIK